MAKILKYKQNLNFFLNLIDNRIANKDFLGALDASRRAQTSAQTKVERTSLNLLIGEIYYYMGLYKLSCEFYLRAALCPHVRASAFYGMGVSLLKLEQNNLALEYFEACTKTQSDTNFYPLINDCLNSITQTQNTNFDISTIAQKLFDNNQTQKAVEILKASVDFSQNSQILLAKAYIKNNQMDEAREIIFKLLKLNPMNVNANLCLCELCKIENDFPNLDTILSNLNTIPLNFSHYMQISKYYCVLNKWNKAIESYSHAADINPFSIEAEVCLSLCYVNLNNKTEALYHIGKAKWIDIENPIVNAISDSLQKDEITPPVEVEYKLPQNLTGTKLENVDNALKNDFCRLMHTSPWLNNDVEWCFSQNSQLTNEISTFLSKCKHKKTLESFQKYLLSLRLTKNQKFYFIKNAIKNKTLKIIHYSSNFRLKSLAYSLPKISNTTISNAYISAMSYSAIFNVDVNLKANLSLIVSLQETQNLTIEESCCLFFIDSSIQFFNACAYFQTDQKKLLSIWKKSTLEDKID